MVIESAADGSVFAEVDKLHQSLRTSLRPFPHRTKQVNGGHYIGAFTTGLTTILNANDRLASMRWTNPDRVFVLKRLNAQASIQTAFGAAQEHAVDLVKLTGFSTSDAGGTPVVIGDSFKTRREMANSVITDLRFASATAVTVGTAVIDSVIGRQALSLGNTLGSAAQGLLYDHRAGIDHPFMLAPNEGFNIRVAITQGATGVVRFVFNMEWMEIPIELLAAA